MYLNKSECNIGIVELFDRIKVEVGESIFEDVRNHYLENGADNFNFNMLWVCYGPKATLEGYEVRIEDGFAEE